MGPELCSQCHDIHPGDAFFRKLYEETRPVGTVYDGVVLDVIRMPKFEILLFESAGPPKQAFMCMHSPGFLAAVRPGHLGKVILLMGLKGTYWKYERLVEVSTPVAAGATVGGEDGHHGG